MQCSDTARKNKPFSETRDDLIVETGKMEDNNSKKVDRNVSFKASLIITMFQTKP